MELRKYVAEEKYGPENLIDNVAPGQMFEKPKMAADPHDQMTDQNLTDYVLNLEERKRRQEQQAYLGTLAQEKIDYETLSKFKFCAIHPNEPIKYYCKDDKTGLCPECIVMHARHDFIFADADSTSLIKLEQDLLLRSIGRHHESYGDLYRKVEGNLRDIDEVRKEQEKKITDVFNTIREAINKREAEFRHSFEQKIKDNFVFMNQKSQKLRQITTEVDGLYQQIARVGEFLDRLDDFTVAGCSQKIKLRDQQFKQLHKKVIEPHPLD